MSGDSFLDDLLASAKREAHERGKKPPRASTPRPPSEAETLRSRFENPENWLAKRTLAVVHRAPEGTLTLLGAFKEHVFRSDPHTRKLIRIEEPSAVEGQEFVTGDYWLKPRFSAEFPEWQDGIEDREIFFDLELDSIQAHAHGVPLTVRLENGWIRSAKLRFNTQLVCPTNRVFFFLPRGLDVLEAMSFANKVAMKKELLGDRT